MITIDQQGYGHDKRYDEPGDSPGSRHPRWGQKPPLKHCPRPNHPDPWDAHDTLQVLIDLLEGELIIMATIDDINTAVATVGADAQAAADRVIAALADASAQIAALAQQVADLIAGNASDVTPEQLQAVADRLAGIDATITGIAPDVTPEPEPEPEPAPEPEV